MLFRSTDDYALREEDLPILYEQYDALASEMEKRVGGDDEFTFFHFMIDLEGGPCVYKRLSGCGSGTEYLAVTPSGELYPCHQFAGQPEFLMGNVDEGITRDDIREGFAGCNVYSRPACRDCFAKYYCSGGCAANAYNFTGDIRGNYELGCDLHVFCVHTPTNDLSYFSEEIEFLYRTAKSLGADMTITFSDNAPRCTADFARRINAKHLITGMPDTRPNGFVLTLHELLPRLQITMVTKEGEKLLYSVDAESRALA